MHKTSELQSRRIRVAKSSPFFLPDTYKPHSRRPTARQTQTMTFLPQTAAIVLIVHEATHRDDPPQSELPHDMVSPAPALCTP